jgi:hypothetical protein
VEKTGRRDFDPALVPEIARDIVRLCLDAAPPRDKEVRRAAAPDT